MAPVEADLPGFTNAQDGVVAALARQLGQEGLQVDDTLPPESRPNYHQNLRIGPLWGSSLAWAGGGTLLVTALIAIALRIRQLRRRT
ncbi:hypothetical protein ACIA58_24130 [Kribbella sp. NPDC051586]|uniref:hypothetical protein n=1 Tax=Kribbella sp. NPDC051586 TaxID=3364118 RepID=UPI003795092F